MIPEVKVKHWKWCETQGNSPHVRWDWCEVNEEVDVYTALWLDKVQNIDFNQYIFDLADAIWANKKLAKPIYDLVIGFCFNGCLSDEGYIYLEGFLSGISFDAKFENIDEKLYTNESL